jgi:hypothetical protein
MQPLSAPISNFLLPFLLFLQFSHHLEGSSDDLLIPSPLVEDPAAFLRGRRRASAVSSAERLGWR